MSEPTAPKDSAANRLCSTTLHSAAEQLVLAKQRTVLLVEDTAAHAAIIRRTLDANNWATEHVTRGSLAIDSFQRDPNRIILLDLSLPDNDGLQLLGKFRNFNDEVPVVVVTATDDVNVSVEAMKLGAWDYVLKEDPKETASRISDAAERAWSERIRRAEQRLVEQSQLLEAVKAERLEAIELTVRTVCHEVNNPLSGVVALSQLLKRHEKLDDELRELADSLVASAAQVRDAVSKLQSLGDNVVEFGGKEILSQGPANTQAGDSPSEE